jgi:hypothetical protein
MCNANKQELCSVAGFTNEDPKKYLHILAYIF